MCDDHPRLFAKHKETNTASTRQAFAYHFDRARASLATAWSVIASTSVVPCS